MTLEELLETLAAEGYLVSNTFQVGLEWGPGRGAFGVPGWQVYLRNSRNTRTGIGLAPTLREAFEAALANARRGDTYERREVPQITNEPKALRPSISRMPVAAYASKVTLGEGDSYEAAPGDAPEDLF